MVTLGQILCMNIMYFNAQSLLPKMDKLRALVDAQKPHIVCIVETWLSPTIYDNESLIDDLVLTGNVSESLTNWETKFMEIIEMFF